MATISSGQATSGFINLNWVCKLNLYCFNHPVVLLFTFVITNMQTCFYICKLLVVYFCNLFYIYTYWVAVKGFTNVSYVNYFCIHLKKCNKTKEDRINTALSVTLV